MKNTLLAKRYAKALFDLAVDDKVLEPTRQDMKLVAEVLEQNRELRKLMANPVIPPSRKKLIIRKIFADHIGKHSVKFLEILVSKGREQEITAIAKQFYELYLEYKNIALVDITTAVPIEEKQRERMLKLFSQKTKYTLQMNEKVDPEIIGGFIVKMNDFKYNASVSEAISRLHKEFDKNLYIKGF
ncbi:MAG: ATP synthase F1 subunit delta [Bacteroidales bacterium]